MNWGKPYYRYPKGKNPKEMCHMRYIRLRTISHKLELAVSFSCKRRNQGNSRHDLDPSSNLGIPSSGNTPRVYKIWKIRQELSSKGLRISQHMALAELFDSCRPQFFPALKLRKWHFSYGFTMGVPRRGPSMYKFHCKPPGKERQQKIQFSAEVSQHCCTSVFESWNQGCFP